MLRRKAQSEMLALKPYRGKPAVRNFREDAGNVGHGRIRHPLHISKEWMTETLCLQPGAPVFYPTPISANVCKGGLTCLSKS